MVSGVSLEYEPYWPFLVGVATYYEGRARGIHNWGVIDSMPLLIFSFMRQCAHSASSQPLLKLQA